MTTKNSLVTNRETVQSRTAGPSCGLYLWQGDNPSCWGWDGWFDSDNIISSFQQMEKCQGPLYGRKEWWWISHASQFLKMPSQHWQNKQSRAWETGELGDLEVLLTKVDKSGLWSRFKVFTDILPRVLWPLLLYDVPICTVDTPEKKMSSFLQRWLVLPKNVSSTAPYGSISTLQPPWLVTAGWGGLILKDPKGPMTPGTSLRMQYFFFNLFQHAIFMLDLGFEYNEFR